MRNPVPHPTSNLPIVNIWTDGSCLGNPGPGGWAAVLARVLSSGQRRRELSGGATETTNNRMEITAAIEALTFLKRSYRVQLHTDSELIVKTMTIWLPSRLRNDWGSVANVDLWRKLHTISQDHDVEWLHVRSHAGDSNNERCDELAKAAAMERRQAMNGARLARDQGQAKLSALRR